MKTHKQPKEFTRKKDDDLCQIHVRLPKDDMEFIKRIALVENKSINHALVGIVRKVKNFLTASHDIVP